MGHQDIKGVAWDGGFEVQAEQRLTHPNTMALSTSGRTPRSSNPHFASRHYIPVPISTPDEQKILGHRE